MKRGVLSMMMVFVAVGCLAGEDSSVIENLVSTQANWAAGSFGSNDKNKLLIVLNTRPKDGAELSDDPSQMSLRGTLQIWAHPTHEKNLHTWKTGDFAGERIYAKVVGKFKPKGGGGNKAGPGKAPPPEWVSNSLDIDIDVGERPNDNTADEDKKELDEGNYALKDGAKGSIMLRKLPPNVAEKKKELQPKAWVERDNKNVDVLEKGTSIFSQDGLKSGDFADRLLAGEIRFEVVGKVTGDCVLTARLTFTDPSTGYPFEFIDEVRITNGKAGVDVDVDYNRNGEVDDDPDDPNEDAAVDFLSKQGALVLVNCDADGVVKPQRDMDDLKVNGDEDAKDFSPVSFELERDLANDEELFVVIRAADDAQQLAIRILDPKLTGDDQSVVGPERADANDPKRSQQRMDTTDWFPDGKKHRYDKRFVYEGLQFGREVFIDLEIRKGGQVTERDTVRVLCCPWLANNNTQPLAKIQPGNMAVSSSYGFTNDHGTKMVSAGGGHEFVQDSVEWGFQIRRQNPATSSLTLISGLRLFTESEDQWPLNQFLGKDVGVYGYANDDEKYFEKECSGDQGGNLECLPSPAGSDFGRIIHGNTMSPTLMKFLARQKAQVKGGAVVLDISSLNLAHVDEVVCIGTDGRAIMPDWELAVRLISSSSTVQHNVLDLTRESGGALKTYGDITDYLRRDIDGKKRDQLFSKALPMLQKQVGAAGTTVLKEPGMYLLCDDGHQRAFPRSIANSQPTVSKVLVTAEPPQEGSGKFTVINRFWKVWSSAGYNIQGERLVHAREHGGEAHCSSNTIREPYKH